MKVILILDLLAEEEIESIEDLEEEEERNSGEKRIREEEFILKL
jgi:hypothetical protein